MAVELGSNNEKPEATPPPPNGRFSWLKSKQLDKLDSDSSSPSAEDRASTDLAISAPLEEDPKPVSFTSLFRFTTRSELALNGIGLIASIAAGAAQSSANVDDAARKFRSVAAKDASYLTYIGVGMFICTYIYMYIWVYTAEVAAKRIRERYLRAILRQDIAFFDKVGPGEVTTRIQTDTHLVQQALSEKVALTVTFISAFVTGFVLAFARNWRLWCLWIWKVDHRLSCRAIL
ncbi:ABC transporter type 1, transmembrane domain-containing protein [Lactifluus subvellereus]|nr:ABC transporter type 1, transmembrane domain-containing protein [Lactifluus subvellereus]